MTVLTQNNRNCDPKVPFYIRKKILKNPSELLENETAIFLFFFFFSIRHLFLSPSHATRHVPFPNSDLFRLSSLKLVPHVPSQQFLPGTKEIDLWRTEFTVIFVYHFPLFLHCFQLGSFKYSSCHTHHFQFTCYAKPHTPTEQPLLQFVQILYSRPEILIHLQTRCSLSSISSCLTGILMHRIETRFCFFRFSSKINYIN